MSLDSSFGRILWASGCVSFPRLGKGSAIISSSKFSAPFFISLPSGCPVILMSVYLMLSFKSLNLFTFFPHLFLFMALIRWVLCLFQTEVSSVTSVWHFVIILVSWSSHFLSQIEWAFLFFFFLRFVRNCVVGRGGISNRLTTECGADAGLDATTMRSWHEPKSRVGRPDEHLLNYSVDLFIR